MFSRIAAFFKGLWENRFNRGLMRYFDWPLIIIVIAISLFGIASIFSASSIEVTEKPATIMEMLETQPLTYARLQLIWLLVGLVAMFVVMFFDYKVYGQFSDLFYWLNIILLSFVLLTKAGRGGMSAFFNWGSDRGFQPSEFGKVFIIISMSRLFASRKRNILTIRDTIPYIMFLLLPLILIVLQPDVGTALVYVFIFCIMIWISNTNWKLIAGVILTAVVLLVPIWYYMNNASGDNFRLTRILIWLDPESYPDEARQVINGQIALGSGGMFGKGVVSPGSFASLGYISDDHTDFIFSVVGEAFGLVGACSLIVAYILMLIRLFYHSFKVQDTYGSYVLLGITSMFLFHIMENICMVIGLLPVTGIPLPFMSYGGSNMLTNMMAIGLAENVIIRNRSRQSHRRLSTKRPMKI